ncbi:MAG TPA: hypothetical protein VG733_03440 [Chthoniobacteraceae bacterium]|nr:hypothetical protein [Chthoniobacteraceae bacterium]
MAIESTRTTEKEDGPRVRQFSVFLKNKVGVLLDVVKLLNEHHVEVLAVNVQDSAESAIVRLVVSDPDTVQELFTSNEIPFSTCDLVVVELKDGAAQLGKVLTALLMAEVNIHGSNSLLTHPRGNTALALHVEDTECACAVLRSHGFRVLSQGDISR